MSAIMSYAVAMPEQSKKYEADRRTFRTSAEEEEIFDKLMRRLGVNAGAVFHMAMRELAAKHSVTFGEKPEAAAADSEG